jgi:DNA-binding LytR/AlgR family response regulator
MKSNTTWLVENLWIDLLEKLKSPFPYYLNDDRKNTILTVCIGLFVVFFLHVYKPLHSWDQAISSGQKFMFGGVAFAILFLSIVILPKLFPVVFDPLNWNIQKYALHIFWNCLVITVVNTLIDKFYICPDKYFGEIVSHAATQVALTGIIPITIMSLLFKNNVLQENLKSAIKANQQLEKIHSLRKDALTPQSKSNNRITLFSDTSETLSFNLPDLLFIQADDNYSTVVWQETDGIQKKLLRINLKNIESQIDNTFAIRCHRSYIVNVHAISNISGNTNGYKLKIKDSEFFIPVSRPKGKEVMEKIQQIRNVMELY